MLKKSEVSFMSPIYLEQCSIEELKQIHTKVQHLLDERHEKRKNELFEKVKTALDDFYREYNAYDICIKVDEEDICIRCSDIYIV